MRRPIKWLINSFLTLLVLLSVGLVLLPAMFSSSLAVVYSGSMAPVMPTGSLAWMEPVGPAEIEIGDIIAFNPPWDPEVTVSHRVIDIVEEPTLGFRTKGDANEDPDPFPVPADNVTARVSYSVAEGGYILGRISKYTTGKMGFGLFIALPTILLLGNATRDMSVYLNPRKRRRQKIKEWRSRRRKKIFQW